MVAVALHHARTALQERGAVPGVVADRGVVRVALDVGLVDDVEAELVAKVVQHVVVGVVARANGGDVVRSHRLQVLADVVGVHRLATIGMVVVTVDAEDPDRLTVDEKLAIDDLDAALKHSQKAVELEPKNAGYMDTLAECHFRKGDRDKALALMKQCAEIDGKNAYFKKQLARFKDQAFDSPTPDEGDEEE